MKKPKKNQGRIAVNFKLNAVEIPLPKGCDKWLTKGKNDTDCGTSLDTIYNKWLKTDQ